MNICASYREVYLDINPIKSKYRMSNYLPNYFLNTIHSIVLYLFVAVIKLAAMLLCIHPEARNVYNILILEHFVYVCFILSTKIGVYLILFP